MLSEKNCRGSRLSNGLTENAGHENDGPSKLQDMRLQDMKMRDQYAEHEIAGHENAGHEIAGQNINDSVDTRSAETHVAARHRCDARAVPHSSCLQLLRVSPLTWKSSQSLQQVMPWLVAGRLRHLRRW